MNRIGAPCSCMIVFLFFLISYNATANVSTVQNKEAVSAAEEKLLRSDGVNAENSDANASSVPVITNNTAAAYVKKQQEISFEFPEAITTDQKIFHLNANASSCLPVTYESSNVAVADIVNDTLCILAPGEVTITASQDGDDTWVAAVDVVRILKVDDAAFIPAQKSASPNSGTTLKKVKPWLFVSGATIITATIISIFLSDGGNNDSNSGPSSVTDRPPSDPVMGGL